MALLITIGIKGQSKDGKTSVNIIADAGPETQEMLEKFVVCQRISQGLELSGMFGNIMPFYNKQTV